MSEMGHCGPPKGEETIIMTNGKINNYPMEINLNQIYLLNNGKIGMDKFIFKFTKGLEDDYNHSFLEIGFEQLIETIAHELAHAIQTVKNLYNGIPSDTQEKAEIRSQCESSGEGVRETINKKSVLVKPKYPELVAEHTQLTNEIKQMTEKSSEYQKFKD